MATRFDHIRKEAGLITALPARSEVMSTKITFEYEGNLQGLIEFMEANFKEPNVLTFKVSCNQVSKGNQTPRDNLVRAVLARLGVRVDAANEDRVHAALPHILDMIKATRKIEAIKSLRGATDCGLKEAKDAVENELADYLQRGGT